VARNATSGVGIEQDEIVLSAGVFEIPATIVDVHPQSSVARNAKIFLGHTQNRRIDLYDIDFHVGQDAVRERGECTAAQAHHEQPLGRLHVAETHCGKTDVIHRHRILVIQRDHALVIATG